MSTQQGVDILSAEQHLGLLRDPEICCLVGFFLFFFFHFSIEFAFSYGSCTISIVGVFLSCYGKSKHNFKHKIKQPSSPKPRILDMKICNILVGSTINPCSFKDENSFGLQNHQCFCLHQPYIIDFLINSIKI